MISSAAVRGLLTHQERSSLWYLDRLRGQVRTRPVSSLTIKTRKTFGAYALHSTQWAGSGRLRTRNDDAYSRDRAQTR